MIYTLTAIKVDTRLFLTHTEGGRSTTNAVTLFQNIEKCRAPTSSYPLFASDNWNAFEEAILKVYGVVKTPPYKRIGKYPASR